MPWRFFTLVLGAPWVATTLLLPSAAGWFCLGVAFASTIVVTLMWSVDL